MTMDTAAWENQDATPDEIKVVEKDVSGCGLWAPGGAKRVVSSER
jgi:hypothetical protein